VLNRLRMGRLGNASRDRRNVTVFLIVAMAYQHSQSPRKITGNRQIVCRQYASGTRKPCAVNTVSRTPECALNVRGGGMLQVILWRCYLNAKYPHAAESIAPLLMQYHRERRKQRSPAEAEAAAIRASHCRCPECPNNPQCVFSSGHSCVLEKYV